MARLRSTRTKTSQQLTDGTKLKTSGISLEKWSPTPTVLEVVTVLVSLKLSITRAITYSLLVSTTTCLMLSSETASCASSPSTMEPPELKLLKNSVLVNHSAELTLSRLTDSSKQML